MFRVAAALALLALTGAGAAQQPTLADGSAVPEAILKISDDGPRMTVPVHVAGAGPFPFIIDTGSERTVISRELADLLKLAQGRQVRLTAMTGTRQVGTVMVPGFNVSSIVGHPVEAPALQAENIGAPGLVGVDTLQDKAVVIDFDHGTIEVRPSRRREHLRGSPDDIIVRARNMFGQLVVTNADFGGRTVRVILDTGSVVSMGNLALQRAMHLPAKRYDRITLTSVTGDTMSADYAVGRELKVGGIIVRDLPIGFADAEPFKRFGLLNQPALMLGMNALRMFRRVAIDFPNREILFAMPRNAGYAPPDSAVRSIPIG